MYGSIKDLHRAAPNHLHRSHREGLQREDVDDILHDMNCMFCSFLEQVSIWLQAPCTSESRAGK